MKKLQLNKNLGRWLLAIFLIAKASVVSAQTEDWQVNASDFEYSMTITAAIINADSNYSTDAEDVIGVFDAQGNCVGSAATSVYFSPLEANLAFVMVYSNSITATYEAKVYDASSEAIIDVGEISFSVNQELGSLMNPHVLILSTETEVLGCTDEAAFNYDPQATSNDGSCTEVVLGCIDADATNYDPFANTNDDSCVYTVLGCTNMAYVEYNAEANEDDGSCETLFVNAYNQLNQTVSGLNENIATLNSLNSQLENQLTAAIASQQSAESALDSTILSYANINSSLASLENQNQNLASENSSLSSSLSTTQAALQNSENSVSVLEDSVGVLSVFVEDLQGQNLNLTSENTSLTNSLTTVQNELDDSNTSVGLLEDSVSSLVSSISSLQMQNNQALTAVDSLTAIIDNQQVCEGYSATIDLPEGWSMFGYTLADSVDVTEAFGAYQDKITIIKDEWGLSWLPEYNYNALGAMHYGEGYQIKTSESITEFQFQNP